jgi:hypothetical protein
MVSGEPAVAISGEPGVVAFVGGERPVAFVLESR